MSRTQRFRPTGAVVVTGAMLSAIALAGCSAGQITQTDTQVPNIVGVNAGVGAVAVRDAYIEFSEHAEGANIYPRGGAAPLKMIIVNSAIQADRLVSASSPAAASVAIIGDAEVPPGRMLRIEGAPAVAASAPSGAARPTQAGATAQPGDEHATVPGDEIGGASHEGEAPAGAPTSAPRASAGDAEAGVHEGQVVLTGLTEDVRAGLTYSVVLNFERAGQVTLSVPVGHPAAPRQDEPGHEPAH